MESESVPVFARVKQTVRIVAGEVGSPEKLMLYVVDVILGDFGQVRRSDILAVQDYRKRGTFDVTFEREDVFRSFLERLEENPGDGRLEGFKVFPHFQPNEVTLTVRTYSPFVPLREIEVVLGKYCKKVSFVGKIWNEIGLWTSKYRFKVVLEKEKFPPARFKLGKVNLDCFFSGMPTFCRRCRSYGHDAEKCELCQSCGESGHDFKSCKKAKKCNFCFEEGHLYVTCPKRAEEASPVTDEDLAQSQVLVEDPTVSVLKEMSLQIESLSGKKKAPLEKEQEVTVKRKKKEKEKIVSPVRQAETMTRGEQLYRKYKNEPDSTIAAVIDGWSIEEKKKFSNTEEFRTRKEGQIRSLFLDYVRKMT
uniref:LOC495203 protein n=1 Tax=Xenopus laevis TaxID=8355 RepID=Q5XGJ9_XENLA|nr:uncharacterized protein LOC495203 [Xenopus laevis]AAH84439.1 LOC495203 protein [Xenopus laevis]